MKGLGSGIMNILFFPFRIFKKAFSFIARPFKFISEQIEFEKHHQKQKESFFNMKKKSRRYNDEII